MISGLSALSDDTYFGGVAWSHVLTVVNIEGMCLLMITAPINYFCGGVNALVFRLELSGVSLVE